jgi:NTP pyrophosphatase (non-canonical NTP hydrolase)
MTNTVQEHYDMVQTLKANDTGAIISRMANCVDLIHASEGITTEGAEIADMLKRHLFYGTDMDLVNLKEEVGDVLWYLQLAASSGGFTLEQAMKTNMQKLAKRYGDKFEFSEDAAVNRDVDAEREILEEDVEHDWIVWEATEDSGSPVPSNTLVRVTFRTGCERLRPEPAGHYSWSDLRQASIVSYQVVDRVEEPPIVEPEWIVWEATEDSESPVPAETEVLLKLRDAEAHGEAMEAGGYDWGECSDFTIVAYKVVEEVVTCEE